MAETLDAFGDFDESSKCCYAQDLAVDDVTDMVALEEGLPHVGLELLHAERQTALIRLDRKYNRLHAVTFFQDFRRVFHALGPAQIADVDQAVDAVFDFDECAEVREISDATFDGRSNREFIVQRIPRICSELAHSERDTALSRIHVEHDTLDLIANVDQLRRMLHPLRPCHLADVDEA